LALKCIVKVLSVKFDVYKDHLKSCTEYLFGAYKQICNDNNMVDDLTKLSLQAIKDDNLF